MQLRKGQTYEVVFSNSRSYGLQIRKIIKGTNKPLSGCVFQVAKANGEIIGKYTTNSAGLATVSGLEDGVYVVTELSCPEGYRLDSTPQNVIVKSGELATVEFQNEKLASIRIKKIDAVTKKGIYGVRFLVKDEANNLIGEYSTDRRLYRAARHSDGWKERNQAESRGNCRRHRVMCWTARFARCVFGEEKRPDWSWKTRRFSDKFRW